FWSIDGLSGPRGCRHCPSTQQPREARRRPLARLHGLWRLVSEPLITPPDQNFALRHASVIHAAPTPAGAHYWVTFGLFGVTGLQVIRADRDRNRLALSGIYNWQPILFDFGHHALLGDGAKEERAAGGTTALRSRCHQNSGV